MLDGRLLSKQQNRMKRFDPLLETLPHGYVFDGEIVCLDEAGKPVFNDLLFRRREPVYVPFDVLNVEGADVRGRSGTIQLPKPPIIAGMITKKIMIRPCPVTSTS